MVKEEKKARVTDNDLGGYNAKGDLMDMSPAPSEIDEMIREEQVKQPAANKMGKPQIEKLFRMFCDFYFCPRDVVTSNKGWERCSNCILREIPWNKKNGQTKDLCYAIWQEDVLNG